VTGWTQLGVLLWAGLFAALLLLALTVAGLVTLGRRLLAAALDEHAEVRAHRRTTQKVPPC
jgi:uncharacterized iron-regulated membrane protein